MRYLIRLLSFLRPYKKQIAITYLVLLLATLFSLALPRLLGTAIDQILDQDKFSFLLLVGFGVLGFSLAHGIFLYFQRYLSDSISVRVAYDLRNAIYDHLQYLSFAYHDKQQTGQLMSRATADVEVVRWFVSFGIARMAYMLVLFLSISGLLLATNWQLGLISLGALPLVSARAIMVRRRLRALWHKVQEMTGRLGATVQENLSAAIVVRAFSREEFEREKYAQNANELAVETVNAERVHASNAPFMEFTFFLLTGIVLWFGGREVVNGRLTAGELTQFVFYLGMLAAPVRIVGYVFNLFTRAMSSGERIFDILDAQSPVQERPDARPLPPIEGRVRFDNVSFGYDSLGPTLSDIDFEVQPGQVVALLGATGSGKTTLVHLIPRFYDVKMGSITIDGIDVRDLALSSLRRSVGIVQQEVFLFADTIKNNIAYGARDAS
ncbi:MAG: ABC transporter ATP-binding protein, partial [Dehalococcoidia bacterium]